MTGIPSAYHKIIILYFKSVYYRIIDTATCYTHATPGDNLPYLTSNSMSLLRWGLIISSFGKLLALPAILWGQVNSCIYTLLASVFIFTSNVSAVKGKATT